MQNFEKIKLSKFTNNELINVELMFKNSTSLKVLDLSDFHFMKVENMRGMFYGCSSLAQVKLSDFKNKNIQEINTYGMFSGCQML